MKEFYIVAKDATDTGVLVAADTNETCEAILNRINKMYNGCYTICKKAECIEL